MTEGKWLTVREEKRKTRDQRSEQKEILSVKGRTLVQRVITQGLSHVSKILIGRQCVGFKALKGNLSCRAVNTWKKLPRSRENGGEYKGSSLS